MLYFWYGEDFSSPAVLFPQLVDYQNDNPRYKPCQELNRYFNPVDWAFSFSSATALRHLFITSLHYVLYHRVYHMSSFLNTLSSVFIHIFINILCINQKNTRNKSGWKTKGKFYGVAGFRLPTDPPGIEPGTWWLTAICSTDWAKDPSCRVSPAFMN